MSNSKTDNSIIIINGINWVGNINPKFIAAQFLHETGGGKDYKFLDENNLFGMRCAQQRTKFYDYCSASNYAVYSSMENSCLDLNDWLRNAIERTRKKIVLEEAAGNFSNPFGKYSKSRGVISSIEKVINENVGNYALFLKENRYYEDSLNNYSNALKLWIQKI